MLYREVEVLLQHRIRGKIEKNTLYRVEKMYSIGKQEPAHVHARDDYYNSRLVTAFLLVILMSNSIYGS